MKSIKELKPSTNLILGEELLKYITYRDVPVTWTEERKHENGLDSKTLAVSVQMNVNALLK